MNMTNFSYSGFELNRDRDVAAQHRAHLWWDLRGRSGGMCKGPRGSSCFEHLPPPPSLLLPFPPFMQVRSIAPRGFGPSTTVSPERRAALPGCLGAPHVQGRVHLVLRPSAYLDGVAVDGLDLAEHLLLDGEGDVRVGAVRV